MKRAKAESWNAVRWLLPQGMQHINKIILVTEMPMQVVLKLLLHTVAYHIPGTCLRTQVAGPYQTEPSLAHSHKLVICVT